ncbi:MAG TPA: hypothetical protein DCZ20_03360 [Lachnospiraceae bacterium]|nr:hypothetical protein [Lachnospiraceae bacterium]
MDNFKFKPITSLEKVFPAAGAAGEAMTQTLTALKGETVSFQIAYYWSGERKERGTVEVVSAIADCVHVRTVDLVACEYPCHMKRDEDYLTTEPGLYPDLLSEIPQWGFPLVSGQWRSLWIDLETEKNMAAGSYPVQLILKKGEEILCEVEITLELLDVELPKLPIPHTEWFHSDCLADYYHVEVFSESYWTIVENFMRTAVKRKCNMILTPVFTPPLDTAQGGERRTVQLVDVTAEGETYSFGFANFERWIETALRCGMEYFEISHLFSQWGAVAAPKIMAMKDGAYQKIFGWNTDASGAEYRNFMHQFLCALKEELKKLGIADKTWFHISDEPEMRHLESYRAAKEVVEEDLKGYQLMDALSDYSFYEKGLVAQPVCALNHIQPFLENRPEKLWGYYCTAQWGKVSNRFIVQPSYRTRILGAQMYKYRLDGFLHWGYNFYNSEYSLYPIDPYRCTDAGGAFPSGDPFLVYPGKDGKPVESIRTMLMDEAMSDYCAMTALEKLSGREAVLACLEPDGEEILTIEEYPRSISYLIDMRERIHQAIKAAL